MGFYLNSRRPSSLYLNETVRPYFVDKTQMIEELIPLVDMGSSYICITRPRRFGKTVMANMISAYFGKGRDTEDIFSGLRISGFRDYQKCLNHYDVISMSFNEIPKNCGSYAQYIERIENRLIKDLQSAYPSCEIDSGEAVWDVLSDLSERLDARFIFVLDEWDFIFHQDFVTEKDKKEYILFLSNLLKDKPYVRLAYMTGILPIAKYSSGSELNMFLEYTMAGEEKYSDYFGFTESDVNSLFEKYLSNCTNPNVTRDGLRVWYDGYHTRSGERVYNPRSVVASLINNNLGNYWTSSGPYDEIFYYIKNNVNEVRDDLALMVSGVPVRAEIREYAATSMNLSTKNEIFSAMVVYGFLSYEAGCVSIPNKELMDKFADVLKKVRLMKYCDSTGGCR